LTTSSPSGAEAARAPQKATIGFIFAVVTLDMLALGMIVPVLPSLVKQFEGGDTVKAAEVMGVFGVAWALMQFLFSPFLGALSDKFGRRPVLLGSLAGHAIDFVAMALAPNLIWLFIGRVISGVLAATVSTAQAYIADITPPEQRAGRFGLISAAWGLGFVAGPALGGILGEIDLRLPFFVAAAMAAGIFAFGFFFVPESLPKSARGPVSLRRANPVGSLALLGATPQLRALAIIHSLNLLAFNVLPSVFVLYASHRYGWGEFMVGATLGGVGLVGALVASFIVRPAVARLGEERAVFVGLACTAIGYLIYGLAPVGWMFWLGVPIAGLGQIYGAAVMALMTRSVGPEAQGRLQGATSSLMGLTGIIGPALFLPLFAISIRPDLGLNAPGLPFLLSATLLATALVVALRVARARPSVP
jgi:MFS transporter, DHA1 family, tetracycline resistance protein